MVLAIAFKVRDESDDFGDTSTQISQWLQNLLEMDREKLLVLEEAALSLEWEAICFLRALLVRSGGTADTLQSYIFNNVEYVVSRSSIFNAVRGGGWQAGKE